MIVKQLVMVQKYLQKGVAYLYIQNQGLEGTMSLVHLSKLSLVLLEGKNLTPKKNLLSIKSKNYSNKRFRQIDNVFAFSRKTSESGMAGLIKMCNSSKGKIQNLIILFRLFVRIKS